MEGSKMNNGKKSIAELSVVASGVVRPAQRPAPPAELTPAQAEEWRAVVGAMPADWFPRETHGLLATYVRHVITARRLAALIAELEAAAHLDLDQYDDALRMQERESRALSALAARMRITQQSHYSAHKRRGPVRTTRKPWEIEQ